MKHNSIHIDWQLFMPTIFLIVISLTILYSIDPSFFRAQLISLIISVPIFFIISQVYYRDFNKLELPLYFIFLILLIFVLILGIESRGAVRWVEIFGKSLQVSELGKPFISLSFAGFLANRNIQKKRTFLLALLFLAPIAVLIYLQPDLGNALLYVSVMLFALVIYGLPALWIGLSSILFISGIPFFWQTLHDYQRQRVLTFLNPLRDPEGSSYNLIQSIIAIGSGGFIGKGISEGTQSLLKFLPENHTDFIFASLAEKLGFVGSLLILVIYVFLLRRIYILYLNCEDNFGKIFTMCSFLFILLQFFVNIGMNLGIVPIVGITLPFISYGGSSILGNFITLGILSSISTRNMKKPVLEIR